MLELSLSTSYVFIQIFQKSHSDLKVENKKMKPEENHSILDNRYTSSIKIHDNIGGVADVRSDASEQRNHDVERERKQKSVFALSLN